MVVSGQMSHEPVEVVKRKRNLVLAQVSLGIAFVFIMCHSIKWIPNIYELLQVCNIRLLVKVWLNLELIQHILKNLPSIRTNIKTEKSSNYSQLASTQLAGVRLNGKKCNDKNSFKIHC